MKKECLYPVFDDSGRDIGCNKFAVATYRKIPVCLYHAEMIVKKSGGFLWLNTAERRVEPAAESAGELPTVQTPSGYRAAFQGAMSAYGILAANACRWLLHVTGTGDDSEAHYWPNDCGVCKEIASFIADWKPKEDNHDY